MRVSILSNMVFDGKWLPTDKRLGGTEESIVQWAERLAMRGHEPLVYSLADDHLPVLHQRVAYFPRRLYGVDEYSDVTLNIKSSDIQRQEPTLYFTNETNADQLDLSKYDAVAWPSHWAAKNIKVNNNNIQVLPHGYDEKNIYPSLKKHPKQCLYASSPDRGLDVLERIWPLVVEEHPDAWLYVSYGGTINAPNVTCGEFTEEEMNVLYRASDIWLHPCNGGELFGITAIKAQAAGCIPIYYPTMALQETVRHGIKCKDEFDMFEAIVDLMDSPSAKKEYREQLANEYFVDWERSTDLLEAMLKEVM